MEKDILEKIVETVDGYHVKNLVWLPLDRVIRGQVKCPVIGKETLHDGYIISTWRLNGSLMPKYGGNTRKDLYLKMNE